MSFSFATNNTKGDLPSLRATVVTISQTKTQDCYLLHIMYLDPPIRLCFVFLLKKNQPFVFLLLALLKTQCQIVGFIRSVVSSWFKYLGNISTWLLAQIEVENRHVRSIGWKLLILVLAWLKSTRKHKERGEEGMLYAH
ncbi:hypothetical protein IC582_015097 [Cucumis melo]